MKDIHISLVVHDDWSAGLRCLATIGPAAGALDWAATVVENIPSVPAPAVDPGRVTVRRNPSALGFGANHNQVLGAVVAAGSARYVLVLNDDIELDPGSIAELVCYLDARPRFAAAAPAVRGPDGRLRPVRLAWPTVRSAWVYQLTGRTEREDHHGGWLQGCALAVRVEALRVTGLFDERFHLFFEDVDLSRRLVAAGWQLGVCRTAGVVHYEHSTVLRPDLVASTVGHGERSRYLYFEKYRGRPTAALMAAGGRLLRRLRPVYARLGTGSALVA